MPTNTSGGTTTSFNNTPQAGDDTLTGLTEDYSGITYWNVLSNDLGGNAKILWSLDDGSSASDLLCQDGARAETTSADLSANGAHIWITSAGTVGYNASYLTSSFRAQLQALGDGETLSDSFTYAIRLANGTLSWATATVVFQGVNDAPTAGPVTLASVAEDSGARIITQADLLGGANDVEGDTLTITSLTKTSGNGTLADNGDGTWTYTPGANDDTSVSFSYTVSDGALTASSTATLDITPVNDAPVNGVPSAQSVNEDTALTFSTANGNAISISDIDAGGSTVRVTLSVANGNLTLGSTSNITVTAGANGSSSVTVEGTLANINASLEGLTYQGTTNFHGSDSLSIVTSDLGNTGVGGALTDTDNIAITVVSVNDAPSGADKTLTILEDGSHTFSASDFGFSDPADGNQLQAVVITSLPASGTLKLDGTNVTLNQSIAAADIAKLVFTPAPNANGTSYATFTFKVQDNGGTANGGLDLDQSANTITIDVTSVNDAPVGTNGSVTTLEDNAKTLAASDFGFTDPNDSPANTLAAVTITTLPGAGSLTLDGVAVSAGQSVSLADLNAGKLVYTPVTNATASTSFTFQVQDNGGTANGGVDLDQSANTITVNVTSVNDAPANGVPSAQSVNEDTVLTFSTANANAISISDVDAGSGTVKTTLSVINGTLSLGSTSGVTATGNGSGTVVVEGTVSAINAALQGLSYTADLNFNGSDTLSVVTTDQGNTGSGGALGDSDTVAITVDAVNDAPQGTDKTVTTDEDTSYAFSASDFGFSDPVEEDDLAAIIITALPVNGSLTLSGVAVTEGQEIAATDLDDLLFTPDPDENGTGYANFQFLVKDDGGTANDGVDIALAPNTITINVTPVDDGPVLPQTYTGDDDINNFDTKSDIASGTTLVTGTNGDDDPLNDLPGAHTIRALDGNDVVNAGNGGDTVYGGTGDDRINGGDGNDSIYGQAGKDILHGDGGNDTIYGGSGDDEIYGDANNDQILYGGSGNDIIQGGDNSDVLLGGFGADTLTGGANSDRFVFRDIRDTNDVITDYDAGPDTLDLAQIDADSNLTGDQAFEWGGANATASGLWFSFDAGTNTTTLFADTDGNAATVEFMLTLQNFNEFNAYADGLANPPTTWLVR